jgi:Gas vesicle protein G
MGLLTLLFRLPLLPVQGVVKVGEIVRDQAESEHHDPAAVRRRLEEAEAARTSGEASDEDVARMEEEAVRPLVSPARSEPHAENRPRRAARHRNRS